MFPEDFQIKVLVLFAKNDLRGSETYLKPEYFVVDSLSWLFTKIIDLRAKFSDVPVLVASMFEIEARLEGKLFSWTEKSTELFVQFLLYLNNKIVIEDKEYVIDTIASFVKKKELAYALNTYSDAIQEGNWEELKTGLTLKTPVIYNRETSVFNLPAQDIFGPDIRGAIQTNFYPIDQEYGGLFRQELTLMLGDTNVGKSLFLHWIAAELVKKKYNVLFVTLEMSLRRTMNRIFISLVGDRTDLALSDFNDMQAGDEKYQEFTRVYNEMYNEYNGYLSLVKRSNYEFSLDDMKQLISSYVQLKTLDVLIVDYIDIMKPPLEVYDSYSGRKGQTNIVSGLRDLADFYNLSILSVTQANRGATNKRLVTADMVAEDYGKIRTADNIFSVGEDLDSRLRSEKTFAIIKSRNSQKGAVYTYRVNYPKVRFDFVQKEST